MQIPAKDFLRLVERAGTLAFVDIEATGLRGDYNSVLVVSIKMFGRKPTSFCITIPGDDKQVVSETKNALEAADLWVGYFSKGFDLPMLNTRLLNHGIPPIEKRPHLDLYWMLKSNILTARRSQGHLLSWLNLPESKMTVSADVWARIVGDPKKWMPTMVKRCESDVNGLASLYAKTKHLVGDITR